MQPLDMSPRACSLFPRVLSHLDPHLAYAHVQPRPSVPGFAGDRAAVGGERIFALPVVCQGCSQLEAERERGGAERNVTTRGRGGLKSVG